MTETPLTIPKLREPEYPEVEDRKRLPRSRGGRKPKVSISVGMTFGDWTVLARSSVYKNAHIYWDCRCVCGQTRAVAAIHLRGGKSKNCGCKKSHRLREMARTHGQTHTRTHHIWCLMKSRCSNPALPNYSRWGGRGIKVCDRWNDSFEAFLLDMGEAPAGLSIDRIDNDGNYEPGNCRWATAKEQCRNQSKTIRLTLDGRTLPLSEWAEITGIDDRCLYWRYQQGWTHERILTTPSRSAETITFDGETLTLKEWASKVGTPYQTMVSRKNRGWQARDVLFGRKR